jgi:hypothetical protein
VSVGDDGVLYASLAQPNRENRAPLGRHDAIAAAENAMRTYALDADAELVLDRVVDLQEAGASEKGSGSAEGPFVTGKLVQYRQVINGVPVITPSDGAIRVTVDNDGTVTDVEASTRAILELSDRPRATTSAPPPPGASEAPRSAIDPDEALARAFSDRLRSSLLSGPAPVGFSPVPGTTEVGYDIHGTEAHLIAQRAVEVEFAGGYSKRYWVKAPLFE